MEKAREANEGRNRIPVCKAMEEAESSERKERERENERGERVKEEELLMRNDEGREREGFIFISIREGRMRMREKGRKVRLGERAEKWEHK